eukprot:TRINITY_DN4144_c0_g2_i12.p1 TRINITY_DN4144_c0_g2~~TRINITY_DN4144_c0_g2_i12.p1  ORF type:complete len:308 (+),score=24.62 TRINITY_DN4144_c0_g2_i12:73-996(+)
MCIRDRYKGCLVLVKEMLECNSTEEVVDCLLIFIKTALEESKEFSDWTKHCLNKLLSIIESINEARQSRNEAGLATSVISLVQRHTDSLNPATDAHIQALKAKELENIAVQLNDKNPESLKLLNSFLEQYKQLVTKEECIELTIVLSNVYDKAQTGANSVFLCYKHLFEIAPNETIEIAFNSTAKDIAIRAFNYITCELTEESYSRILLNLIEYYKALIVARNLIVKQRGLKLSKDSLKHVLNGLLVHLNELKDNLGRVLCLQTLISLFEQYKSMISEDLLGRVREVVEKLEKSNDVVKYYCEKVQT